MEAQRCVREPSSTNDSKASYFLLLMVIGWITFQPNHWGIGFAAFVGFLTDLVFRSPLGLHVFLFVFIGAVPYLLSGWLIYFNVIHRCVLVFILIAVILCSVFAWFAVLFTGRYPKGIFDFVEGFLRWSLRVNAYAFLLTTDQYPPFKLG